MCRFTIVPVAALFAAISVLPAYSATAGAPTLRLPDTVAPTSYRAQLTLDPTKDTFEGTIAIQLQIKQPVQEIWLNGSQIDVREASLTSGGKKVAAKATSAGEDLIGFQLDSEVPAGRTELTIAYSGKIRKGASEGIFQMEEGGDKYLFTQFEATDARDAFPCFDEPSYKTPWELTLRVPAGEKVVSDTSVASEQTSGAMKIYSFEKTKPLPSYLIAFGVGPFEFVDAGTAGKNHVPVRIVTPKGKQNEAKYAAEVTATILTRLEDYFGIPYPFQKSDQVAIPTTFGFGAMENAGMVTYAQTLVLAKPESDTINRQRGYASVAAHELAHQWFGDLVTPVWWNDIWLNEAFATWMQQKLIAEWKPEWEARVSDVGSKLGAERQDSLISARKIRQEITSKNDISNAFDAITYQKGAAVIGMFESWIGSAQFRKGVQSYLKQHEYKNATAGDFLDSLSTASGKNVTASFSTFLNQPGVPMVGVTLDCSHSGGPALHLNQKRYLPLGSKGSGNEVWQIPVCARYGTGETGESECTLLTQQSAEWALKTKTCPAWVEANDNAVGYYRVAYAKKDLDALTHGDVDRRLSAAERVDFMGNAEALSLGGELPAADALGLVMIFHNDPARQVVQSAINIALAPRVQLVPQDLMTNYQRFLRNAFQARAHELEWTEKPGDSDDARLLRPTLLRIVSTYGDDLELAQQAERLTNKWFEDHRAISPELAGSVLATAAYYGDKALFERFLAEHSKTQDRQVRQRILGAMGAFRDRAAIEAAMNAVLSGGIPFIEGAALLFAGQGEAATREMPFDFLRAHYDEIVAKRPSGGGADFGARLPSVGRSYCDTESRTNLANFFESRISKFVGGPRSFSNVLEEVDLCIAQKAAQEPSVVEFLQKY